MQGNQQQERRRVGEVKTRIKDQSSVAGFLADLELWYRQASAENGFPLKIQEIFLSYWKIWALNNNVLDFFFLMEDVNSQTVTRKLKFSFLLSLLYLASLKWKLTLLLGSEVCNSWERSLCLSFLILISGVQCRVVYCYQWFVFPKAYDLRKVCSSSFNCL